MPFDYLYQLLESKFTELYKFSEFIKECSKNKFPIGGKGDVYDFMLFFESFNLLPIKA